MASKLSPTIRAEASSILVIKLRIFIALEVSRRKRFQVRVRNPWANLVLRRRHNLRVADTSFQSPANTKTIFLSMRSNLHPEHILETQDKRLINRMHLDQEPNRLLVWVIKWLCLWERRALKFRWIKNTWVKVRSPIFCRPKIRSTSFQLVILTCFHHSH